VPPFTAVQLIEFGFALDRLFVRVNGQRPLRNILEEDVELRLRFIEPAGVQVVLQHGGRATPASAGVSSAVHARLETRQADTWQPAECTGLTAAAGDILEVQIPFACLGATPHTRVAFLVAVTRAGQEVEHHPRQGPIELEVPDRTFPARSWTA
jgi:hypothetical protein